MSTRTTLAVGAIAFAAGLYVAKFVFVGPVITLPGRMEAQSTGTGATQVSAAIAAPSVAPAAAPSPVEITQASTKAFAVSTAPIHIIEPKRKDFTRDEAEEHLIELIRDRFPEPKMIVRKQNEDGGYGSREMTDDGGTITRNYNPQGVLIGEDWKQPGGDDVIRTYFDTGAIKGFSLHRVDGTVTNVTFTQSGLFKARSDDFPDGDHVYTNYDDQGQELEKWRKTKDGQTVRIH